MTMVDYSVGETSDPPHEWPENMYIEARDMAAVSFLVYTFSYITDTARKHEEMVGIRVNEKGRIAKGAKEEEAVEEAPVADSVEVTASSTLRLEHSFTPSEVKKIVEDNIDILKETYPSEFENPDMVMKSLQLLQERIEEAAQEQELYRPLTLVEFDDKHQKKEPVYAVAKDDINRRITVVLRGTENSLAFISNWSTNAEIAKVKAEGIPDSILEQVSNATGSKETEVCLHGGFYKYLFSATADTEDDEERTKFDEIMEEVVPLLKENPTYKLYVTGHSLGAALSSIVAMYMAMNDSIPDQNKPVSCINYASPRVGNKAFLDVIRVLEASKRLRFLRVVNDNDSVAFVPWGDYHHAGFQIRLHKRSLWRLGGVKRPKLSYPKWDRGFFDSLGHKWDNSIVASMNLSYDHGDYRERIETNKKYLVDLDLNLAYKTKRDDLSHFSTPAPEEPEEGA